MLLVAAKLAHASPVFDFTYLLHAWAIPDCVGIELGDVPIVEVSESSICVELLRRLLEGVWVVDGLLGDVELLETAFCEPVPVPDPLMACEAALDELPRGEGGSGAAPPGGLVDLSMMFLGYV